MDAMQNYFHYSMAIPCGIPSFVFEGYPEDWRRLRRHAAALQAYDLDWWIPALLSILDEFISASEGNANTTFWENFYREQQLGCGDPRVNGHVLRLFPYLPKPDKDSLRYRVENDYAIREDIQKRLALAMIESIDDVDYESLYVRLMQDFSKIPATEFERNPFAIDVEQFVNLYDSLAIDFPPSGLSYAPFTLTMHNGITSRRTSMEFIAGFLGMAQDKTTLALRPEIGWAIREKAF